jgi:hypothetical protein
VQIDNWNQTAVKVLLADAQSALALTQAEEIRGAVAVEVVAAARANYIDLVRRSNVLIMTNGDLIAFQRMLDHLRACLRFFGESV